MSMGINFQFEKFTEFRSRRSPVLSLKGIVSSSQVLASQAGISILQKGGNAADAAVATAAALAVTEPMSTGIGGDCFALFFDAKAKVVRGLNGSGRSPSDLTIEKVRHSGEKGERISSKSADSVTVPGAVAGWFDTVDKFGTLSMEEVLAPAIRLAEEGFPVYPITAFAWSTSTGKLRNGPYGKELLLNGQAPEPGQVWKNPNLARVFRTMVKHGKPGFYEGWVASAITDIVQSKGGILTHEDLASHKSTFDDPISTNYRGVDIHEIPPNGQGITALMALNLLEDYDIKSMNPLSPQYYHIFIECMRLAFADSRWFVADPAVEFVPAHELLSKVYAAKRRKLINLEKATLDQVHGAPQSESDTVYLAAVDGEGNACSFINSNYEAFGTGLVPKGTGFTLQNRGSNFSLNPDHPNALAPSKRPYHTIIPAMATQNGELFACFGVMGGWMQPQGHVQVISKIIDHEYDPQAALDAPRFCIMGGNAGGVVALEDGIPPATIDLLSKMGHEVQPTAGILRAIFGNGQIIRRDPDTGVLWAGADPRGDGSAIGY